MQATGITLSRNQHAHIGRLVDAAGLRGRVDVRLLDYRELRGSGEFDRIASVGMFEHVGHARMDAYFDTLRRLLRPGVLDAENLRPHYARTLWAWSDRLEQ